jgi:hypothetical protein
MSHFTVLVIGDDVEGQLAKYNEDISVAPYAATTRKECVEKQKKILASDDVYRDEYLAKVRAMTEEEFWADQTGHYDEFNSNGEPLSTYNPDSKWDWYLLGGRWTGVLPVKEEFIDDEAAWEHISLGDPGVMTEPAERGFCDAAPLRMLNLAKDFSTYAAVKEGKWYQSGQMGWWGMSTEEVEPTEWAQQFHALLDGLNPDTMISLLDCHI